MDMKTHILGSSVNELSKWNFYFDKIANKSIYHDPYYIKSLEGVIGDSAELFVLETDGSTIYYPYFKKSINKLSLFLRSPNTNVELFDIVSSWYYGGPIASTPSPSKSLLDCFHLEFSRYCANNNIISEFIRFDANIKNYKFYNKDNVEFNRETVCVDLRKSKNEILNNTSSANRRALRKSKKMGYVIRDVSCEDDNSWRQFWEIYNSEMKRKKAPKHLFFKLDFFIKIRSLGDRKVKLLVAEKDSKMTGGFIVVFDENYAFHFLSASNPDHWDGRVNNLMFTEALFWAQRHGCLVFDFMGGRLGVFKFKKNFSSLRAKFYTYKAIHNSLVYNELCEQSPDGTGFFPAYRA
ncbi:GNAT family N-acetyltransferase [Sulfurovum sp.]|uniref:GNAT family N-acetyltransferase n=1 Tax=Sulfurovum sp. TaxID=1969726 RepID=UPI003569F58F